MPDHIHILLNPEGITLERTIGLIKGGFSQEIGSKFPVSQRGFADHRVRDREEFETGRQYIDDYPVRARIVANPYFSQG
jgi:putative transposase